MGDRRSSFEYEDLLACGRGELFGQGNAQLPLPPMLMFDRIAEISETGGANGKGVIRAAIRKVATPGKTAIDIGCAVGKWLPVLAQMRRDVLATTALTADRN